MRQSERCTSLPRPQGVREGPAPKARPSHPVRAAMVIDPDGTVRTTTHRPTSAGRNVAERRHAVRTRHWYFMTSELESDR